MKINQNNHIVFDAESTIIAATLSKTNELVILNSLGNVVRYNINENTSEHLFSTKSSIVYANGGFDINAKVAIFTMDEIVVVVNEYKTFGFVHYPQKYTLNLQRTDYYAEHSSYPIALFKDNNGIPHLIYSQAWNHTQIMNLDTRQVLTAAKSLIEEDAEEKHLKFYTEYEESNKLLWPRSYDYFFGALSLSPNQKNFLSAGWGWGSCDCFFVYNIDDFIKNNRISDKYVSGGEHENRGVCWVSNDTIAMLYSPFVEGDDEATRESPCEIHFYKMNNEAFELEKKIQIIQQTTDQNIIYSKIYYNEKLSAFLIFSKKLGFVIIDLNGQIIYQDSKLIIAEIKNEMNLLVEVTEKEILIYELNA